MRIGANADRREEAAFTAVQHSSHIRVPIGRGERRSVQFVHPPLICVTAARAGVNEHGPQSSARAEARAMVADAVR